MTNRVAKAATLGVTLACAAVALGCSWVTFTFQSSAPGLRFSVGNLFTRGGTSALFSYGLLSALLCMIGGWALWKKRMALQCSAAIALLLLVLGSFLQVALLDSDLLFRLIDDQEQARESWLFSVRNLPPNFMQEPTRTHTISTETVWDRITTAQYFMGFAWYAMAGAGLIGFACSFRSLEAGRERRRIALVGTAAAAGFTSVCLTNPVLAQYAMTRAVNAESNGNARKAIDQYRRAMALDSWFHFQTSLHQRIGSIDATFGRTDTLEYHIFKAEWFVDQNDLPSAIAELEPQFQTSGSLAPALRARTASLWAIYGQTLYRAGAPGVAQQAWEKAIRANPRCLVASFCLSRAYFEVGRYQESVDLIIPLLPKCSDPSLLADLYSNLGDDYTKLGQLMDARVAYRNSYKYDAMENWRGLTALVGGS